MPRKRLSKDDLVERIRTGLDTKGWEITKTATRAMLDELGVVAREELVQGNEFAAPGIVLLQTEKRSSRQGVRHVAQRVDRQRHGRTTRGPARRPAAPRAYDTRPSASTGSATGVRHAAQRVDRQRHGRTTRGPARRPAAPRAYDTRPRCVDRQRHGRTTRGPARRPAAPRAYDTRPSASTGSATGVRHAAQRVDRQRHGRTTRGPGASTGSATGVRHAAQVRRLAAPWALRHVAQRVDYPRRGRTTRSPARRPAAPWAYDT